MYLTAAAVLRIAGTVAGFATGTSLCFDYRVPVAMLNPIERAVSEFVEQQAGAIGEAWLSAFDPAQLQRQLTELGFKGADSPTPEALNTRYFARRKDGMRTGGGVRLMCATK